MRNPLSETITAIPPSGIRKFFDIVSEMKAAISPVSYPHLDDYNDKYLYVTHSELNAILNYRGGSLEGSKLYVTLFPCNECAKSIIQAGIRTIIYESDK